VQQSLDRPSISVGHGFSPKSKLTSGVVAASRERSYAPDVIV